MRSIVCSLVGLMLLVTVGCTPPSRNLQDAILNSSGQVATVALLDNSSTPEAKIVETKKIVAEIRKIINQGEVGSLTLGQLQEQLNKIVPIDLQVYSNQLLSALQGLKLPTDKLGPNNIERINEVLDGIDYRCDKYHIEATKGIKSCKKVKNPVVVKVIVK